MIEITILDSVHCEIDRRGGALIKPILCYPSVFYKSGAYRKERVEYLKTTMMRNKSGKYIFFTGFLPRVKAFLEKENQEYKIDRVFDTYIKPQEVKINLTLRPEQQRSVDSAISIFNDQRGVLIAPTGIGKTLLGVALASAFPKNNILWLCHTKDLLNQTIDEFKKMGLGTVGVIGSGEADIKRITVGTRQSVIKFIGSLDVFDIVVVDEAHHVSDFSGQYSEILKNLIAPIRIGLTATFPDKEEAKMALEAFIGPIIDQITYQEASDLHTIAKPKIKIIKTKYSYNTSELRTYPEVYERAIIFNRDRNSQIKDIAISHALKNESVLIIVHRIEHGKTLEKEIKGSIFVYGATEDEARMKAKMDLNFKKQKIVIASTIFSEGINIPELNIIINAAGGKSEIRTIQTIGRGLRITDKKKELLVYDFFDPSHRYLIAHFGERISLYSKMDWI